MLWLYFISCFTVHCLTGSTLLPILQLYLLTVCGWGLVITQFAPPPAIANSKIHIQDTVTKPCCPSLTWSAQIAGGGQGALTGGVWKGTWGEQVIINLVEKALEPWEHSEIPAKPSGLTRVGGGGSTTNKTTVAEGLWAEMPSSRN